MVPERSDLTPGGVGGEASQYSRRVRGRGVIFSFHLPYQWFDEFLIKTPSEASLIQIKLKRECLQRAAWPSCHLGGRDQADLARATSSKGAVAPR